MIRTLVIDDSATIRRVFTEALQLTDDIEVVGTAPDAFLGLEAILALNPDVITLDIEMPHMDGLTFLTRLMQSRPMPVVVISSVSARGSNAAMRALELGAVDVLCKPSSAQEARAFPAVLARSIQVAAAARLHATPGAAAARIGALRRATASAPSGSVFAIGASTGGTEAIRQVLTAWPGEGPPIVIVQHLPPQFTKPFAERLNEVTSVRVAEAVGGEELLPGTAWVAPGGRHMAVVRHAGQCYLHLSNEPPEHFQRPAVDVLFRSVAKAIGRRAVGAVLTGMGQDGVGGLLAMRQAGARTFAQDQDTSVIFGMPRVALERGAAERACPLHEISTTVLAAFAAMET